jgi:hypothetical protein
MSRKIIPAFLFILCLLLSEPACYFLTGMPFEDALYLFAIRVSTVALCSVFIAPIFVFFYLVPRDNDR